MPRAPILLRDIQISRAPGFDDPDLRADPDLEVSPVLLAYLASACDTPCTQARDSRNLCQKRQSVTDPTNYR